MKRHHTSEDHVNIKTKTAHKGHSENNSIFKLDIIDLTSESPGDNDVIVPIKA